MWHPRLNIVVWMVQSCAGGSEGEPRGGHFGEVRRTDAAGIQNPSYSCLDILWRIRSNFLRKILHTQDVEIRVNKS